MVSLALGALGGLLMAGYPTPFSSRSAPAPWGVPPAVPAPAPAVRPPPAATVPPLPWVEVTAPGDPPVAPYVSLPLGSPGVVLVPLELMARGGQARFVSDGRPLGMRALQVDWDLGLVRLIPVEPLPAGLPLSSERHPLYLGREVVAHGPRADYLVQVDGPALATGLGRPLTVALAVAGASPGPGLPVVNPVTGSVVGLVYPGEPPRALDVSDIAPLVSGAGYPLLDPGELGERFRRSHPRGLMLGIEEALATGRLGEAVDAMHSLAAVDPAGVGAALATVDAALSGYDPVARPAADWPGVLDLVGALRTLGVGLTPRLRLVEADANAMTGALEEALVGYGGLLEGPTGVAAEARQRLRHQVAGWVTGESPERARELLARTVELDPDHAPHHLSLGRLAVRLGDRVAALTAFRRATQLEPRLAAVVAAETESLVAARGDPAAVSVPVTQAGGLTLVRVRINGHDPPLRFILDTGASHVALAAAAAQRIGVSPLLGRPVRVLTANHSTAAQLLTLDSVAVGGVEVRHVAALVLPGLEGADGLLGQTFLRHYDIRLEQGGGVLTLRPRGG